MKYVVFPTPVQDPSADGCEPHSGCPLPRPLCRQAWHGVWWGGGKPLWVYLHIGYRTKDSPLHIYIYIDSGCARLIVMRVGLE